MTVVPTPVPLDLSACAQEPIHIPGSIQPYGILLVLDANFTIKHVSANIEALLGMSATGTCGTHVSTVLGPLQGARFVAAMDRGDLMAFNPTRFVLDAAGVPLEVECTAHRSLGALVVEFEPFDVPASPSPVDLYAHLRIPIALMEEAQDIVGMASVAATAVQVISGFDRAMVYRFDEDWHGEVIAEAKTSAVPVAYLGLHFPASDIPEQARRLYLKNALRLIPDVDYRPAALIPEWNTVTGASVDLSHAILRSVSPYHIEYLQNMGVRATLTISIVINGRLWGLIACHHYRPRRLEYGLRAVCELLGHMLAWKVGSRLETDGLQEELRANAVFDSHTIASAKLSDLAEGLVTGAAVLMDLFTAQGLVIRLDGATWRVGATPADDAIVAKIAAALSGYTVGGVGVSHQVGEIAPSAADSADTASGAMLVSLSESGDEYLLYFREELIESVHWGGDPRKPVTEYAGSLRPRQSFVSWRETMRGRSARWSTHDTSAARGLRQRIFDRRQTIERGLADERIRFLAHYDTLTQLPNRASFHDALRRSVGEAKRDGTSLALLFVDLDRLKLFNDAFGHATGDLILQEAATRMRRCVRHDDVVARLGGDEFVVLLPNVQSERDADLVAGKILAAIAEPFFVLGCPELRFTASVGIALYPKDAQEAETLLRSSDIAMYRAKELGRNDFQRFGGGESLSTYEGLAFERRLEHGLTLNEFKPFYQPIVCAKSGRLLAMEALARWVHPELGILPPSRFIALAEESRLILILGKAILKAACLDCTRWRAAGNAELKVSVNVSARQFRDDEFLKTILETLAETGLDADALQLELTESMLIGNEQYATATLRTLAEAGVTVAIDDFGTGYSSLSYLRRLRVDALKIDQSFVRDLTPLPDETAIVRAIIAMAHSLKLEVIAEGVETVEQLAFLRAEGCDAIQGFLIGKPIPYADAIRFIENFEPNRYS